MSKFVVFSCSNISTEETNQNYSGDVAILACAEDPSLMLFFPLPEEHALMLDYVLEESEKNTGQEVIMPSCLSLTLGMYQTMVNSWRAADRYLSGIVMDMVYDPEMEENVMSIKLIISSKYGGVDSLIRVNFIQAVILSLMEGIEIIVTNELLTKLMPNLSENKNEDEDEDIYENFPKDENMLDIVKNIMKNEEKPQIPTNTNKTTTLPEKTKTKSTKPKTKIKPKPKPKK